MPLLQEYGRLFPRLVYALAMEGRLSVDLPVANWPRSTIAGRRGGATYITSSVGTGPELPSHRRVPGYLRGWGIVRHDRREDVIGTAGAAALHQVA